MYAVVMFDCFVRRCNTILRGSSDTASSPLVRMLCIKILLLGSEERLLTYIANFVIITDNQY